MSIDESFTKTSQQQTQFNAKLNKIGKMIGNKLYNIVSSQTQDQVENKQINNSEPSKVGTNSPTKLNLTSEINEAFNSNVVNSSPAKGTSSNRSSRLKELNKIIEKNQNTKFIFI